MVDDRLSRLQGTLHRVRVGHQRRLRHDPRCDVVVVVEHHRARFDVSLDDEGSSVVDGYVAGLDGDPDGFGRRGRAVGFQHDGRPVGDGRLRGGGQ